MPVLIAIAIALVIFGGILGGFILTDYPSFIGKNWHHYVAWRFLCHAVGISPLFFLWTFLSERKWPIPLAAVSLLLLLNMNPLLDILRGEAVLERAEARTILIEEYNNISSEFDYSTTKKPHVRFTRAGSKTVLILPEAEIKSLRRECGGLLTEKVAGLRHLKRLLYFSCRRDGKTVIDSQGKDREQGGGGAP